MPVIVFINDDMHILYSTTNSKGIVNMYLKRTYPQGDVRNLLMGRRVTGFNTLEQCRIDIVNNPHNWLTYYSG
jgi:hypothetical protein